MDARFRELVELLDPKCRALVAAAPVTARTFPEDGPKQGVYLFSEAGRHLYVGRSNKLRARVRNHCRPNHRKAAFAFRLAREATGRLQATYVAKGSRADLVLDPQFLAAFRNGATRIASMDLRYVEETDPLRQALLEIYVATVLRTPYNDFDNH